MQLYHGYRLHPTIISHAVWLYHRFCLSLPDVEDLLAERGIAVSYESIRHLTRAIHYREFRSRAFCEWQEVTCAQIMAW